jgi:hypothetical protein
MGQAIGGPPDLDPGEGRARSDRRSCRRYKRSYAISSIFRSRPSRASTWPSDFANHVRMRRVREGDARIQAGIKPFVEALGEADVLASARLLGENLSAWPSTSPPLPRVTRPCGSSASGRFGSRASPRTSSCARRRAAAASADAATAPPRARGRRDRAGRVSRRVALVRLRSARGPGHGAPTRMTLVLPRNAARASGARDARSTRLAARVKRALGPYVPAASPPSG